MISPVKVLLGALAAYAGVGGADARIISTTSTGGDLVQQTLQAQTAGELIQATTDVEEQGRHLLTRRRRRGARPVLVVNQCSTEPVLGILILKYSAFLGTSG